MIAHDSWWSNERARFNYHRLSSTIIDYHAPFDQGLTFTKHFTLFRVIMVVGAGRGPLVRASLTAGEESGRKVRVYAVEKNPNAVVT